MFALPLTLTDSVEIKYGVIFTKKAKLTSPKYDIHYTRPIQGLEVKPNKSGIQTIRISKKTWKVKF